jgi:hypothetical protein
LVDDSLTALIVAGVIYEGNKTDNTGSVALTPKTDSGVPNPLPAISKVMATYSFISGGVHSVDQFRRSLQTDAALAAQFPDFDFGKAHFEVLGKDACAFVAYRVGNKFAWTRHCIKLTANEMVLTDGHYNLRAKCGNLISVTAEVPLLPQDVQDELDADESLPNPVSDEVPTVSVFPIVPGAGISPSPVPGPAPLPIFPSPVPGPAPFPIPPSPITGPGPSPIVPFPCVGCVPIEPTPVSVPDGDKYVGIVSGLVLILAGVYYASVMKRK